MATTINVHEVTPTNLYEAQHSSLFVKASATVPTTSTAYDFDATDSSKFKIGSQDAYLDPRFAFDGTLHNVNQSGSLVFSGSSALGNGKLYTAPLNLAGYSVITLEVTD